VTRAQLRAAARRILRAGLAAVEPGVLVRAHLRTNGETIRVAGVELKPRRLFVVSVGKAALPMARAAHQVLGNRLTSAIVISPRRAPSLPRTRTFVAGHPVPDRRGVRASRSVIELLTQAGRKDVVLLLLSGGASALMPAPLEGVTLQDKQAVTRKLLRRGANIAELNAVRKRLSRLKGGGFAGLAAPARVFTLALSDVPGDEAGTIGSGPTVIDSKAPSLARAAVRKYLGNDAVPAGVKRALERRERRGRGRDTSRIVIIGSGTTFARAAGRQARALGFRVSVRPNLLQGEARACGPDLVRRFESFRRDGPACLIATGETVVRVRGKGKGGRNQELALASIEALARAPRPTVLASLATDGKDGRSSAAGGMVDDRTARSARTLGVPAPEALARNDSFAALRRLGGLLRGGPTQTNVADVTVILG
jgi:glycerate-2-kinase